MGRCPGRRMAFLDEDHARLVDILNAVQTTAETEDGDRDAIRARIGDLAGILTARLTRHIQGDDRDPARHLAKRAGSGRRLASQSRVRFKSWR